MRDRKVERKKAFCIESILVYYRNKIFKSLPIKKRLSNHPCKKFSLLFSSHFGEIINDGPGQKIIIPHFFFLLLFYSIKLEKVSIHLPQVVAQLAGDHTSWNRGHQIEFSFPLPQSQNLELIKHALSTCQLCKFVADFGNLVHVQDLLTHFPFKDFISIVPRALLLNRYLLVFSTQTSRVCLVGGEIGRMEKKERKMVGRSVWLGGGGGGNFGGAHEFSPRAHQNTISPNWGENARENCANIFDKNGHAKSHCVSAAALCFLFFF